MSQKQLKKLNGIRVLVGNTPMLKIEYRYQGEPRVLYAKAEYYNISGSIKDRLAYYVLRKSYEEGCLKENDAIHEATSGNTGIAFSVLGSCLGHPVTIYMPNWMSAERINLIRSFGANIRLVTPEEGGFLGSIAMAENAAKESEEVFLPRQFDNQYNCQAHYETTGPEIWNQAERFGFVPDAFVAGVGTGGTIMGVGHYLREKNRT
ncbi:MAG: cysteine synthase family protein [Rikenellaceae bacterium]|nr:cysteine synthase family protein [Rikenellaceae bacterium]